MKNAFSVNIIFVLLIIIGCSILPLISFQFLPSRVAKALTIKYEWKDALPEVIEKEVTSKLEGLATTVRGIEKITSKSSKGEGVISLYLDDYADVKLVKFEINALIRSFYKTLPDQVSIPVIKEGDGRGSPQKSPILYYKVLGPGSSYTIQKNIKDIFEISLASIEGIDNVAFYGGTSYKWQIVYNADKLKYNDISLKDLESSVRNYFHDKELGVGIYVGYKGVKETLSITLKGSYKDNIAIGQIPVKKVNNKIVYVKDLAKVEFVEQEQRSYSRVNGLNTINMVISAEDDVNQIELAGLIRKKIEVLKQKLPETFSLILIRDSTEDLVREIQTVIFRIVTSLSLIFLLILIINRKTRYLFIIILSLIANLCIAFILYFLLGIDISIYALAGITVSFGILIDNSILMLDHLRHKNNKNVFLAILAATLTTVGALSVIFLLEGKLKINLLDFVIVISINLFASLIVTLFFIPALLEKLPIASLKFKLLYKRKRKIIRVSSVYKKLIYFNLRIKKYLLCLSILVFGLPIFMLPQSLEGEEIYVSWYNSIFNTDTYISLRPYIDKVFGGTLRMFTEGKFAQESEDDKGRTHLIIQLYLPDGAILEQTNHIAKKVENYLSQFKEIDKYFTYIYNVENARIEVLFKQEYESGRFPEILKEELIVFASNIGGCDIAITGFGVGFSNKTNETVRSSALEIKGYNYETVLHYANETKKVLSENPRIQKVAIKTGAKRYKNKPRSEYIMDLDNERLIKDNISINEIVQSVKENSFTEKRVTSIIYNDEFIPVVLKSSNNLNNDGLWHLNNVFNVSTKLKDVGRIVKEQSKGSIFKKNQEFKVLLEYDFLGSYTLGEHILETTVNNLNNKLPIGFSSEKKSKRIWDGKAKSQYWLVFLVIAILYIICAIVFESLWQPLVIILMIPFSLIGVFLTFSIFDLNFNQGGYASLLLLCGLLINSALYIINDYNNLNKKKPMNQRVDNYIKAYNSKIIPVMLTILSTILGLIPFLTSYEESPFWFALAAGTIGGLLFSILVIIIYLPLFMFWRFSKSSNTSLIQKVQNSQ